MTRLTYRVHGTDRGDDWRDEGACRQVDPDEFFAKSTHAVRKAKRVCDGCPVRQQCTQFALDNDERFGVWGGLSQKELRALRSRRKQATA
jgi:WhiB family redox-sensing transcriptional regulator